MAGFHVLITVAQSFSSLDHFPPTILITAIRIPYPNQSWPIFPYHTALMCNQVQCPACPGRKVWCVDQLHTPTCAPEMRAIVWQKCEACSEAMGDPGTYAAAPEPTTEAAPHQQLLSSITGQSQGLKEELIETSATQEEVDQIMAGGPSSSLGGGGHSSSNNNNNNNNNRHIRNISADLYEARQRGQQSDIYEGVQPTYHAAQHTPFFMILAGHQSDVSPLPMSIDLVHTEVSRELDEFETIQQAQAQTQEKGEASANHTQK